MDQSLINDVFEWGRMKGLHTPDLRPQALKLLEQLGELADGIVRKDDELVIDAVGDLLVDLIQFGGCFAKEYEIKPEGFLEVCLYRAWKEIENRKGETVDGVFVKGDPDDD